MQRFSFLSPEAIEKACQEYQNYQAGDDRYHYDADFRQAFQKTIITESAISYFS